MYNRLTHNTDSNEPEFCYPCYLCKHPEERPIRNKQKCSMEECDYLKCYEALSALEDKIEKADKVEIYYPAPHKKKYAIIEYWARVGKPLDVGAYYIKGEELKTGNPIISWEWSPSSNFDIVEDNFSTEEEAKQRLKELRAERKKK